jgi:hypothetical protein
MTQNYTTVVGESASTAAARAEIERLTHLLDLSKKTTEAVLERTEKAEAEIERLKANLQKAHEGWQAEVKIIRDIADDNLTCAETAEAKSTQLHVALARLRNVDALYQSLFKDFCERGKIITTLESDLSAERELADRLAEVALRSRQLTCLACDEGFNYKTGDWVKPMFNHNANITAALKDHAVRRNK